MVWSLALVSIVVIVPSLHELRASDPLWCPEEPFREPGKVRIALSWNSGEMLPWSSHSNEN